MGNTVITIARSYGSGGRTLGKLLAKELGINYYDRELIRMASDESGINEALFGEVDEKLKKSPLFRIVKKHTGGKSFHRKAVSLYPMTTSLTIRQRSSDSLQKKSPALL